MIKRFVKMSFKTDKIEDFKQLFRSSQATIKKFEGCKHVELLQDVNDPSLFFTFSLWDSELHLDAYRKSQFFEQVWGNTKILFREKAQAWSLNEIEG
jgi:heme-degrading monooxygenase HmoA